MASFKIHIYRGPNDGTESCDFRGDNAIGSGQGDAHRTVIEVDPASDALIDETLLNGTSVNKLFNRLKETEPDMFGKLATALGLEGEGPVGLRAGIWDN